MDIRFEKLNIGDDEQLNSLVKWESDKDLYHLITPVRDKNKVSEYSTYEIFGVNFMENDLMIKDEIVFSSHCSEN
jgi:hypothetical protein